MQIQLIFMVIVTCICAGLLLLIMLGFCRFIGFFFACLLFVMDASLSQCDILPIVIYVCLRMRYDKYDIDIELMSSIMKL